MKNTEYIGILIDAQEFDVEKGNRIGRLAASIFGTYELKSVSGKRLMSALETLPKKYQKIIYLRFGLDETGKCRTIKEVAMELGETAEDIRQHQNRALKKLRSQGKARLFYKVQTNLDDIENLDLPCRVYRALKRAKRNSIKELISASDEELLLIEGIGIGALAELREKLKKFQQ